MTLRAFSESVHEMYELAEQAGPHIFRNEVARIIGRHIAFDRAVLCTSLSIPGLMAPSTGSGEQLKTRAMSIEGPFSYAQVIGGSGFERDISHSLAQVSRLCEHGWSRPIAMDYRGLDPEHFSEEGAGPKGVSSLSKLLFYGDKPSEHETTRWMVLYRNGDKDFDDNESALLEALWRHVTNTISMNLNRALDRIDTRQSSHAMALVNERGMIEVANAAMAELLQLEWPANLRSLPLTVITSLLNNSIYRGRHIEMHAVQRFGYLACSARKLAQVAALSPSERNVADHFAKGLSHSQIAAILRVSPHTVRNQLAQVYLKLGVHNKVELARAMTGQ